MLIYAILYWTDTLADKINRDPSDATAIVYSNDDMNIILDMSLSYYAEYLLGSEARLEQVENNGPYCSYVSPQRWRPTS